MAVVGGDLVERLQLVPTEAITLGRPAIAVDALRISEGLITYYGVLIRERLPIRETVICNAIESATLTDALKLLSTLYLGYQDTLTDTIGVQDIDAVQRVVVLFEKLGLSEALVGNGIYQLTILQALRLTDKLARFFGAEMLDTLGLDDATLTRVLAYAGIAETVGVEAVLTPQLFVNVVMRDTIGITPEMAIQMLFNPTLIEGVQISAGMLEPSGSFTTWAMNTRSGAVTEYQNYAFNSFAPIGNKYVGASEDGLFELLGDDDDGESIVARLKGGYLQFGGTQLSRLKEAYIASTGEGRMVLRIRTKDQQLYHYAVDTRDGRSTKVHMGKGQRSRYFAWELISAGQDFDLDTLEFVPIVVQRRV